MTFTSEQAPEIKEQLIKQIENSKLENKEQIKEHLQNLDEKQLKEFLKQNNLEFTDGQLRQTNIQEGQTPAQTSGSQCIFCSITKNEIPSHKIAENTKAIAILELNPLSKGHSIVIPLDHIKVDDLPKSVLSLAQKIAKKIKTKLKSEDVKIETSSFQGHAFVNIIPIYKDGKLKKYKAEESELNELQSILETKKRGPRGPKKSKSSTITSSNNLPKISFRIP